MSPSHSPHVDSVSQVRCRIARASRIFGLALTLAVGISASNAAQAQSTGKKGAPPDKTAAAAPRTVLVFDTDTKGGVSDQVSDDIVNVIEGRLSLSKQYAPIEFRASIPTVKLAVSEQTLTQADVKKPFDSDSKLKKLSGITGYDLVFVSSIDDYEYDAAKNQVSVVMSARLIDYSGAKSVVRSAAQSATSPAGAGNTTELKIATALVRSLMDKLMTSILTPKPTTK